MSSKLAVGYEEESLLPKAQILAQQLNCPIDKEALNQLCYTAEKLVLKMPGFSPLAADFSLKTWQKRRDAGKQQGLVRACKPHLNQCIIDATAGWGRDAAILASFGASVLMLERQPIIAALLSDALLRQDAHSQKNLRLQLQVVDSITYLQDLAKEAYPEVIYIDSMHPERQKSALVKKDMQALQQLIGEDKDVQALLAIARARTRQRVVLKWPAHLPPLSSAISSIGGKTVRFDIFSPC